MLLFNGNSLKYVWQTESSLLLNTSTGKIPSKNRRNCFGRSCGRFARARTYERAQLQVLRPCGAQIKCKHLGKAASKTTETQLCWLLRKLWFCSVQGTWKLVIKGEPKQKLSELQTHKLSHVIGLKMYTLESRTLLSVERLSFYHVNELPFYNARLKFVILKRNHLLLDIIPWILDITLNESIWFGYRKLDSLLSSQVFHEYLFLRRWYLLRSFQLHWLHTKSTKNW